MNLYLELVDWQLKLTSAFYFEIQKEQMTEPHCYPIIFLYALVLFLMMHSPELQYFIAVDQGFFPFKEGIILIQCSAYRPSLIQILYFSQGMHRFTRAISKFVPVVLALNIKKPIFHQEENSQKLKENKEIFPINLSNIDNKQISNERINQSNQESPKSKEEESEKLAQNEDVSQLINQRKQNQLVHQKIGDKPIRKNKAIISANTPKFIREYLQMQGVEVTVEKGKNRLTLINEIGDQREIDLTNQNNYGVVLRLSNFLNPPEIISSEQDLKKALKQLSDDENIVATYIPPASQYNRLKTPKTQLDSFTAAQRVNIDSIEKQFRIKKYDSISNKNRYLIIRDEQIARKVKINTNKIGLQYILYKTTFNQGMETSANIYGEKITIKTNFINAEADKDLLKKGIYGYINQINLEGDMQNFIRSLQMKKQTRKLLVIYSKQRRADFLKQLKSTTLKAAKMLKQNAIVMMTDNPKLLTDYLQISPDDFVTVRVIDLQKSQQPLIQLTDFNSERRKYYSRAVLGGGFTVENICKFLKGKKEWKQYYENKRLGSIESMISQGEQIPNNTVVLHWKHGCKGCQLTLKYLQFIKDLTNNLDDDKQFEYQIEDPKLFRSINFRKFNILNQDSGKNEKDHDVTPKLILYTNGKKKDLLVGDTISKIGEVYVKNQEKVHKSIIKQIIEKINSQTEREM